MPNGYCGSILHVDLTEGKIETEHPDDAFYRRYLGGSAMGMHYLLFETTPGADPLGLENTLCLMTGVITGAPFPGQSRVAAVAKSPVTQLVGDSQAGGFWPAELKFAGFDGIVITGQSAKPVYLLIHDGAAELRDAGRLVGRFTADVEDTIREELDDAKIQVLQCGPAGERGVRFGALINHANRANGRTGMGTVMGSKNLRAVAVRGTGTFRAADPEAAREIAKWGATHFDDSEVAELKTYGTPSIVLPQNESGGLPTRNWSSGVFEGAESISGERMNETILTKNDTCYGCIVRCKRVVEVTEGPFIVDERYGGPEYETLAAFGSYCGISDLPAVARANQLCNMYGMDTISCGATVAWAMDCVEQGLLSREQTDGLDLRFGNAEAMVQVVEAIGKREGIGDVLAEGSQRAAEILGVGQDLVVASKAHEFPAHMPEVKRSLALIYAVNPFGADHQSHEHDPAYEGGYEVRMAELGLHETRPSDVLDDEKVRYALRTQWLFSALDSVCACQFVFGPSFQLYGSDQLAAAVSAVTGWTVDVDELLEVGERRLAMMRLFNQREGTAAEADTLPAKVFQPLRGGPSDGAAVDREEFKTACRTYYEMAGWDDSGRVTEAKLAALGLADLADASPVAS